MKDKRRRRKPKAPSSIKDLSPSQRKEYERVLKEELAKLQPHLDAAADCSRLTWEDYAIRINT